MICHKGTLWLQSEAPQSSEGCSCLVREVITWPRRLFHGWLVTFESRSTKSVLLIWPILPLVCNKNTTFRFQRLDLADRYSTITFSIPSCGTAWASLIRGRKTWAFKHHKTVSFYIDFSSHDYLWSWILCVKWDCHLQYKRQRWGFCKVFIARQFAKCAAVIFAKPLNVDSLLHI